VVFVAAGLEARRADAKKHQIVVSKILDSLESVARDQNHVSRTNLRFQPADLDAATALLDEVALVDGK
jgi:hypothetical protein